MIKKILSIGNLSGYGTSNTCFHRNYTLKRIGEVDEIDTTIIKYKFIYRIVNYLFVKRKWDIHYPSLRINTRIRNQILKKKYDLIWIDKGLLISKKTLEFIKKNSPSSILIGYSPDNMAKRHNQSLHFIESLPYYDYYVTTKSYTVVKLYQMGAKNVILVNNAYEETFHHPYDISPEEKERLGGKVGFIGMWEKNRCDSILYLAKHGIPVRVWGAGKWLEYKGLYPSLTIEDTGLFTEDYNKALSAFDISLCFLRKMNNDLQTTRTMEIPACGSLLMAERTTEHEALFKNGEEAVFFSNNEELLEKCRYYLSHTEELKKIAKAGRERCISSGYSNIETIKNIFTQIGILK